MRSYRVAKFNSLLMGLSLPPEYASDVIARLGGESFWRLEPILAPRGRLLERMRETVARHGDQAKLSFPPSLSAGVAH
jgi:hypothetical protein